ncbi:hypothetical protein JXJ21_07200 [candidate division KSB1 bacterium]|nr:hypothetical protein [candidate division KSB1 bacterium]
MKRQYWQFIVIFMLCASFFAGENLADSGKGYIALLVEAKGTVRLKRKGAEKFATAAWGSYIYEGDQLQTGGDSKAALLFSNGNMIALHSNGSITLTQQGEENALTPPTKQSKLASKMKPDPKRITLDSLTYQKLLTRRTQNGEIQILPAVRSLAETIIYPRQTAIRQRQPRFTWHPVKDARSYKITLQNSEKTLWSMTTSDTVMSYPGNQTLLDYGCDYTWSVFRIDGFDTVKTAINHFRVLSFDEIQELLKIENKIENLTPKSDVYYYEFLRAVAYEQYGLRNEAISQFQWLYQMNPGSAFLRDALTRLYNDLGLYQQALVSFTKI